MSKSNSETDLLKVHDIEKRPFSLEARTPRRIYQRCLNIPSNWPRLICATLAITVVIISTLIALLIYITHHLRTQISSTNLQKALAMQALVASWSDPNPKSQIPSTAFSGNIAPIPCHSHNDYWRRIPLYEALAAGCTGVEADVWAPSTNNPNDHDLLVGHTQSSLSASRTLKSMYIDPLVAILTHQNPPPTPNNNTSTPNNTTHTTIQPNGIFTTSPLTPLTLLIDIKSPGFSTLPLVFTALAPLRAHGWLTTYNGTTLIPGPITVVATGNTPFDLLLSLTTTNNNSISRDIFYDAPLDQLAAANGSVYNATNSYYASVAFGKAVGSGGLEGGGVMKGEQREVVRGQVREARERGLKSRYWDAPGEKGVRERVWDVLVGEGVGMLNVDDVEAVGRRVW